MGMSKSINSSYALPSGQIVTLPEHCADAAERFTLATGELVWAVRVGDGDPAAAARLAASLPAPRKPMGARRSA